LEGVDRIHLAQDKDQWWALVNTVMNLRFHRIRRIVCRNERVLCSQGLLDS